MSTRNVAGRLEGRYESIGNSVSFDKDLPLSEPSGTIPHDLYDEPPSEESIPRHTQFLDLTNGEGGGDAFNLESGGDDDERSPESAVGSANPVRRVARIDPSTPGKVVETGQEHTGRWTREEHEAFLNALQMYGKEWKKVAAKVKTRTVVQTRTHAQKYFQKLQKVMSGGEGDKTDVTHVEMGVAAEAKKASAQKKKRRQPTTASTHAAAHLMTHLSTAPTHSPSAMATSDSFGSAGVLASGHFPTPHGFSTPSSGLIPPRSMAGTSFKAGFPSMKIKAPDPDSAFKRGKFPEPSPAACGKRKVAEIAAARMLAGVAASGGSTGGPLSPLAGDATPPPQAEGLSTEALLSEAFGSAASSGQSKGLSLQIMNPESMGIDLDARKRRRGLDGEASPTTPWEGQLKALVSEAKIKEAVKYASLDDLENQNGKKETTVSAADISHVVPHPILGPGSGRSAVHKAVCEMNVAAVRSSIASFEQNGEASEVVCRCDDTGYYPIHSASSLRMIQPQEHISAPVEITRTLLSAGADAACTDADGNTPLHWAARSGDDEVALLLLMKNCPLDVQNHQGETPLHWAMRVGRTGMRVVNVLLQNGAREAIFNKEFKRPLDVAADGFTVEKQTGVSRVSSSGSLSKLVEKGKKQSKPEQKKSLAAKIEETRETRANFLLQSTKSRSLVLHHPECLEHIPKSEADWENPDRVNAIMRRIAPPVGSSETTGIFSYEVTVSSEFDKAKLDLLSRVHSAEYLGFVNDLSKDLESKQKQAMSEGSEDSEDFSDTKSNFAVGVPFTPMVQRSMMKVDVVKKGDHSDTSFSAGSLRAARRAAGAVQHAVDRVLVGRNRNAFCVVRPPGHHAGVQGLLDGGESCGFCIFNNVAAGAMHAISDERLTCERCAIVDIDVHHGNGTEEIVKKCYDPGKLFFFSIHLYDNDKKKPKGQPIAYKFYPGTGDEDDVAHNIINVPITPLWKEVEGPLPTSSAPRSHHNTRRKAKQKAAAAATATAVPPPPPFFDDPAGSPPPLPFGDSPRDSECESSEAGILRASDTESESVRSSSQRSISGGQTQSASPRFLSGAGRHAYRRAIQHRLIPALRAFNPDLILISAGFDAAKGDVGNAKHMFGAKESMGMDLLPADYGWATRKILEVADICCQGRVVSVLEGGYGRTPIPPNDDPEDHRLDKGLFSECAVRHLQAMIDPYDAEERFPS